MTPARTAFTLFAGSAYDPATGGGAVAWQRPGGVALLLQHGNEATALPGSHPALGGARIAWRDGDRITTADVATLRDRRPHAAPGASVLAVSETALAWRTRDAAGTDRVWLATPAAPRLVLESRAPAELGRPAFGGNLLLCHTAGPSGSSLLGVDLTTGAQHVMRADPGAQITNPASDGRRLLYVHATGETQQLRIGPLAAGDPDADTVLLVHHSAGRRDTEHEPGRHRHRQGYPGRRRPKLPPRAAPGVVATLWSTALSAETAYVTRLRAARGRPRSADILSVPAAPAG